MKAIMISIQPQWVEKILNGEKTIEIRKTKPSCELPCKVYIYCTMPNKQENRKPHSWEVVWLKRVVAEFTLNKVDTIEICDPCVLRNGEQQDWHWFKSNACLDSKEIISYIGYGNDHDGWGNEYAKGYAWHIDDLKIYDKPKELSEFYGAKECPYKDWGDIDNIGCWESYCEMFSRGECRFGHLKLERPPRSLCYVEELENE